MAIRCPAIAAALLVALCAQPASAFYDESTNTVVWPFEGVVESMDAASFATCCSVLVSDGQQVSGELRFGSSDTGPETVWSFSMQFEGGPAITGGYSLGYLLQRGPGAPDQILAGDSLYGAFSPAQLVVSYDEEAYPLVAPPYPVLALVDIDGVAFDGLVAPPDPDLPPVFAPDAAIFETRSLRLIWPFIGAPLPGPTIAIRIDSLPIPEPGTGWLAGASRRSRSRGGGQPGPSP